MTSHPPQFPSCQSNRMFLGAVSQPHKIGVAIDSSGNFLGFEWDRSEHSLGTCQCMAQPGQRVWGKLSPCMHACSSSSSEQQRSGIGTGLRRGIRRCKGQARERIRKFAERAL